MKKIRVLIIDDSALIRKVLTELLNSSPDIEVIGAAEDPLIAREMIKQLNPDVLTLDIEMPHMDGLTFLRNLMRLRPTPVVMISSLTERGAEATLEALALGAVDFVAKPKADTANALNVYADEIILKVKIAANTTVEALDVRALKIKQNEHVNRSSLPENHISPTVARLATKGQKISPRKIILLGASTGGTEAIKVVAKNMPADSPPILITQHLPPAFSESFVRHIDLVTNMNAVIPKEGQIIEFGYIYLAPGDKHMEVVKSNGHYVIRYNEGEPVNRHKPSVDVMFQSAVTLDVHEVICVLLTGMGADGAVGMQALHDKGAKTIVQDEASSVVWGMPGSAYKLGCADHVVPLNDIAAKILTLL